MLRGATKKLAFRGLGTASLPHGFSPKPIKGTVPIALGNAGPLGIQHAAEYADEWAPIDVGVMNTDGKPDVLGGISDSKPRRRSRTTDLRSLSLSTFGGAQGKNGLKNMPKLASLNLFSPGELRLTFSR